MIKGTSSTADLPDTTNVEVMRKAIAWQITRLADFSEIPGRPKGDDLREMLIKAYTETYNAILANERQQGTLERR